MPRAPEAAAAAAAAPWTDAEREAWSVPPRLTHSQWASAFGVIPDNGINPEPGPINLDRTPYLRGILDAACDPVIQQIILLKCTQVGFSTLTRLFIASCIDTDPGPTLALQPDEDSAKEWIDEDLVPMLEQTPRLQRYRLPQKKANKDTVIRLSSMRIFAVWATSPAKLARRPIRYFIGDEIDKYPPFSGRESDPISLALKRLSNWGRRAKSILGSTPTTRTGNVWLRHQACADRRYYAVPCPSCGHYQRLLWPQVKWDKAASGEDAKSHANRIGVNKLAWHECGRCQAKIHDLQKPRMLRAGVWVSEGQEVSSDGTLIGDRPASSKVGFHLSAIYSPWLSFAELASEWILAQGDPSLLMDFSNSRLGEPFEQQTRSTHVDRIRQKAIKAPEPGIVPAWAQVVIATADTQGLDVKTGWFPWVLRAWGWAYRSQLIQYGVANTFEELLRVTVQQTLPVDDGRLTHPSVLLIDAGGKRTGEVYEFARVHRDVVIATKGSDHPLPEMIRQSYLQHAGIVHWLLDTNQTKDLLARLIDDPDPCRWLPHNKVGDDYCTQLAGEHKIFERKSRRELWVPKSGGVRVDFWDCEHQQCAAAWQRGMFQEPPPPLPPADPQAGGSGWQVKPW